MDEQLLEDFLRPMGITARCPAADIDVPTSLIGDIVHCRRPLTTDIALRLGLFFSMDPRFGLTLQTEYDLRMARRRLSAELAERVRVFRE
jgi:addiction module HigA family antidote